MNTTHFQTNQFLSTSVQITTRYVPLLDWVNMVFSSGMSETKARRLAREGEFEGAVKIGGSWYIDLSYESKRTQKLEALANLAVRG